MRAALQQVFDPGLVMYLASDARCGGRLHNGHAYHVGLKGSCCGQHPYFTIDVEWFRSAMRFVGS